MDLTRYGIHVQRVEGQRVEGPRVYKLERLRKLAGHENMGRHHIYVRVWDKDGMRLNRSDLRIRVQSSEPARDVPLDKPNSPMELAHGDVPMWFNDTYNISIVDSANTPSDSVTGLHARHPDEERGNTWGHHSFLLEFQEATTAKVPDVPDKDRVIVSRETLTEIRDILNAWLA